jgi:chromosomal replication initiation ATPase DnaA
MNFDNARSIRAKEAHERKLMRDARKRRAAELAAEFQITLDAWILGAGSEPQPPVIPKLLFEQVIEVVIKFYGIPRIGMLSKNKTQRLAMPRQIAMYLGMELTQLSSPQIGARLGGRDHSTVLWGAKKIRGEIETDQRLATEINYLRQRLQICESLVPPEIKNMIKTG